MLTALDAAVDPDLEARLVAWFATPLKVLIAAHGPGVAAAHAARFQHRVILYAPLYVTSACLNDCSYCGFRRSRRGRRVRLGVEEALREADCLATHGHRTLDLVSGEVPQDRFIDQVCELCSRILEDTAILRINLNLGALSGEQFDRLRAAGAAAVHVYQETYDPATYASVHRHGPKRDMVNRLKAPGRALAAGFQGIGLGLLLGLAPLCSDLARLAAHARSLRADFPAARIGFSLPRMQTAGQDPGFVTPAPVADDDFVKAFLFLRVEFPDAHLTLTTRERPEMRDALLPLGVTKLSAGVSTAAGGYTAGARASVHQFSIQDERPLADISAAILAAGLVPASH